MVWPLIVVVTKTWLRYKQFNPKYGDWPEYVERLEQYFLANDIDEEEANCGFLCSHWVRNIQLAAELSNPRKTFNEISWSTY